MSSERFSHDTRLAVRLALKHAARDGKPEVGVLDLWVGLGTLEGSSVARTLSAAGFIARPGDPTAGHAPATAEHVFSQDAKSVLSRALQQAISFGQREILTEHLLLALLEHHTSSADRVPTQLGLSEEELLRLHKTTLAQLVAAQSSRDCATATAGAAAPQIVGFSMQVHRVLADASRRAFAANRPRVTLFDLIAAIETIDSPIDDGD